MTLVILAAGMGSRYGQLKQLDPFTEYGEFITDFSCYDARCAGFDSVLFIIKPENLEMFRNTAGKRIEKYMKVSYAFQTYDAVSADGLAGILPGRVKPLGTGHALLCARGKVDDNFCVINCDDMYGRGSYAVAAEYLKKLPADSDEFAMCGFILKNTLADTEKVSRGICNVKDGFLDGITERTGIRRVDGGIVSDDGAGDVNLDGEATVSMNFWCFTPAIFPILYEGFSKFTASLVNAPEKERVTKECYIPSLVDEAIKSGKCSVRVLRSGEEWHGVTYAADKESVVSYIGKERANGKYPTPLFS